MKAIKDVREERGVTQKKMAELLGISRQTYASYEAHPEQMTIGVAKIVCSKLGISYDDIFFAQGVS